jgi:hypothetical protein
MWLLTVFWPSGRLYRARLYETRESAIRGARAFMGAAERRAGRPIPFWHRIEAETPPPAKREDYRANTWIGTS